MFNGCARLRGATTELQRTCRKYDLTTHCIQTRKCKVDGSWMGEQEMTLADSTAQQTYNKLSVNRKNTNTATAVHQECCAPRSTDMHSHSSC